MVAGGSHRRERDTDGQTVLGSLHRTARMRPGTRGRRREGGGGREDERREPPPWDKRRKASGRGREACSGTSEIGWSRRRENERESVRRGRAGGRRARALPLAKHGCLQRPPRRLVIMTLVCLVSLPAVTFSVHSSCSAYRGTRKRERLVLANISRLPSVERAARSATHAACCFRPLFLFRATDGGLPPQPHIAANTTAPKTAACRVVYPCRRCARCWPCRGPDHGSACLCLWQCRDTVACFEPLVCRHGH